MAETQRQNIADILCIGCQKGATSWLHWVLSQHPDTHVFPDGEPLTSTNKEAHFWDRNHHLGMDWYRELMAPPRAELKSMDFTPEYAPLPDHMIDECKWVNPGARVIYVLRDPLARAVSALRMQMLWTLGPDHDAPLVMDTQLERLISAVDLDSHSRYMRNYTAWKARYGDLLLLSYEGLAADPRGTVARVMAHVGLNPARLTGEARGRFEAALAEKVWASQPFVVDRDVLFYLEGMMRETRREVEAHLRLRFAEGPRLLAEAARSVPRAQRRARGASSAPPFAALPAIRTFYDIVVGPSPDRMTPGVFWPDFETEMEPRLWRWNKPRCFPPPPLKGPVTAEFTDPAVYVSMYDPHFGHTVSETVPRLPQSLAEFPDLPLIFNTNAKLPPGHPSAVFRSIMDWLSIPLSQIRFIHEPTLFRELHVAAQAEHLDGPLAPPGYLELLEARTHDKLGELRPEGITYVSRVNLAPQRGVHAAESYLVEKLRELGVRILIPEEMPLPEQMRAYANAKYLVFAEGSAIHGRQLIGRVDQHISILRRRFRSAIAQHQMAPRAASLTYVPCFAGSLKIKGPDGSVIQHAMSSLMNPQPVIDHFEGLGVPLGRVWDQAEFLKRRDHDLLAYARAVYGPRIEHWLKPWNDDQFFLDQFEELSLQHLLPEVREIVAAKPK